MQWQKLLRKMFFQPMKKCLILTKIIINLSNEKFSHAHLKKKDFTPKENFLVLIQKTIFQTKNFLYLPAWNSQFSEQKKSCMCQKNLQIF